MYVADYHIHTSCSPDGSVTMAAYARRAIELGIQELCFTDHLDTVYWDDLRPRDTFPWDEAVRQFEEANALYGDKIKLKLGAEAGEAYMNIALGDKLQDDGPPLDFVIGSVHYIVSEKSPGGYEDLYFLKPGDINYYHNVIDSYLHKVVELIDWGRFDVMGHITLPLRPINEFHGNHLTFEPFYDRMDAILKSLIESGKGIECNTNRGGVPLPDRDILERYRALGGEIITLGSDTHTLDYLGYCVKERQELLKDCGFTYFTTFTQKTPEFHKL